MPTTVGQQVLTSAAAAAHASANKRWQDSMQGDVRCYDTDVLVVGAGPTGLTLAASLVARGVA